MRAILRHVMPMLWALLLPLAALAHEVRPAIGDLTIAGGTVTLELALNAEALVAGVDLDGVENTNDTDLSAEVDALRALEPEALTERLRALAPQIAAGVNLRADGAPVALEAAGFTVDPVGNVELPRDSQVVFTGAWPAGAGVAEIDWPREYGTLVLRQQGVENGFTGYLSGGEGSGPIPVAGAEPPTAMGTFAEYIPVGFDHILPKGLDHILFVLGLFFLSTRLGPLVWQVSAFTLAHTITLALAALGWVNIPGSIVEPLIAASIVYVAVENIVSDRLHRWRPLVVFGFGLLHGLGFASVLAEFGLPESQFIPALIGFNVGVEVGQLTVIAGAFLLVWLAQRVDRGEADYRPAQIVYGGLALAFVGLSFALDTPGFADFMGAAPAVFFWPLAGIAVMCALAAYNVDRIQAYRRFVAVPASLGIALVGAFWFVERVFL